MNKMKHYNPMAGKVINYTVILRNRHPSLPYLRVYFRVTALPLKDRYSHVSNQR
jgi:hypothetical protein